MESGEEARGWRAAQGQAGPSAGLRACGERLFAQKARGGTLAAGRGVGKNGLAGRRDSAGCAPSRKEGKGRAGEAAWTRTVPEAGTD